MVSDDQVTDYRSILRRRYKGIGRRRRWWIRSELAATPFFGWKLSRGDSPGGSRVLHRLGPGGAAVPAVSARTIAAALWRSAATTNGGGSVGCQCGLFHRQGVEIPNFETEGVTKWDHWYSKKASNDVSYFPDHVKLLKSREIATASIASLRRVNLSKTRKFVNEIESEPTKMSSVVKNLKDSLRRERKVSKKIHKVNSKLFHDIAEVKLSAKKIIKNLEKEKKARLLLEDVLVELAKEIEANGDEIWALKNQLKRIQEEVEKERKMLQLAEVWREERAQMKLKDARLILEHKYAEMNDLIANLLTISRNSNVTRDMNPMNLANILKRALDPVNVRGTKEFTQLLPKSDHKFKIIKDSKRSVDEGKSREHYEVNDAHSKGLIDGDETVTQAEICSSQNLGEISHEEGSVNKIRRSHNQKSDSTGITSVSMKQPKKKGSCGYKADQRILPRNKVTCKRTVMDGHDLPGQLGSPDRSNPHVVRAMKGHIEWPRGTKRPGSGANLLEAKLENQKMLMRNILKHRS